MHSCCENIRTSSLIQPYFQLLVNPSGKPDGERVKHALTQQLLLARFFFLPIRHHFGAFFYTKTDNEIIHNSTTVRMYVLL